MNELDADMDLQYNPRARIPDFVEHFARWKSQSQHTRESLAAQLDVPFGSSSAETLDYFPASGPDAPLLVFIHGGYWRALDKGDFSWIAPPYVGAGIAVAVLNYGLLPRFSLADIVAQIRRAIVWLLHNAERLGVDARRIYCAGHSAGGHLTAMMLATDWRKLDARLPERLIAGAMAISGLFDLEPLTRAPFLRADLNLDAAQARTLSPAHLRLHTASRLGRAVGQLETTEFHRQARMMAQHWPGACCAPLIEVAGRHHLSVCDDFATPASVLFQTTRAEILDL
jgi:arylformamidase